MENKTAHLEIQPHALFATISELAGCMPAASAEQEIVHKALNAAEALKKLVAEQHYHIAHLKRISTYDQLTGILNRRGFESELEHVLERAKRYGEQGALVYIDLDHFKEVNDTYGHTAGDAVLVKAANILETSVRGADYVARLGGDEFVVLLVNATEEQVNRRAKLLVHKMNHAQTTWMGHSLPIQASVGVQRYDKNHCDCELIEQADAAMYQQKQRRHQSVTSLREYHGKTVARAAA